MESEQLPRSVRYVQSRVNIVGLVALGAVFVGVGILMIRAGQLLGWLVTGFFTLGVLALLAGLRRPTTILLDEDRITVTLGRSGELAIDDEVILEEEVPEVLGRRLATAAGDAVLVVVRADAGAPHRAVRDLLRALRAAGAERLAIGTRQAGGDPR